MDVRPGAQQRLRRFGAAGEGLDSRQPARDEPRARGQRRARLCAGRAGGELLRPLRASAGRRPPALAVDPGSRLGERDRQHARVRPRLHQPWRAPRDGLRPRGRARQWRGDPHGNGGDVQQQGVERLSVGVRPVARRSLLPVQLRDRHQDGRVADAPARGVPLRVGEVPRRRHRQSADRRGARADARRDDPQPAVARLRARRRRGDQLRGGGVGAALRALRPRGDGRRPVRARARGARGDSRGRGGPAHLQLAGASRRAPATTTRCTAACPAWN